MSFTRFSCGCQLKLSATTLWLLVLAQWCGMKSIRRRREGAGPMRAQSLLIYCDSCQQLEGCLVHTRWTQILIERSKVRNKWRRREDERVKGKRREGRKEKQKESETMFREQNFPQLGIILCASWKAFEQVMMFTLQVCCQFFWHLCHFIPRGGNGKLCLHWVCIADVITFAFS